MAVKEFSLLFCKLQLVIFAQSVEKCSLQLSLTASLINHIVCIAKRPQSGLKASNLGTVLLISIPAI